MTDEQPPVKLDVPYFMAEPQQHVRVIKWCDPHWADLMFALKDRGLQDQIAVDAEELNQKFVHGELDPCWEATNMINMGALECFGPTKVVEEYKGCPVCAFSNMIQHIADHMAVKYGRPV